MAFTGNKFEFRMLGSSQSISGPNIALNTIMAEELQQFADQLEKSKNFQADLEKLIKRSLPTTSASSSTATAMTTRGWRRRRSGDSAI